MVLKNRRALSSLFIVLLVVGVVLVVVGSVIVFLWVLPGNQRTETLDFSGFSSVEVSSAFKVTITQSASYSVMVSAGERVFDRIEVTQEGQTLKIGVKPGVFFGVFNCEAEITMPNLDSLGLSGASSGTADGFSSSNQFNAQVSGASSLDLKNLNVGNVNFEVSGASHLTGQGTGSNLTCAVSGASNLDLTNFSVNDANVDLSGASHATIKLDGRLDAQASGASNLEYIGEPTLGTINTSGLSEVKKK
jgi:hypothetical protein